MIRSGTMLVVKAFPWTVLAHLAFFIAFWVTNSSFYSYTNDYLADKVGPRIDYVSLCLLFSAALWLWTAARLLAFLSIWQHRFSPVSGWLYAFAATIYLVFFYGSFWLLLKESPVQASRLGQILSYFRIILDPILFLALALLAAIWVKGRLRLERAAGANAYVMVALPFAALALIWVLMFAFPPDSVYSGAIPPKPLIIAHRGASMLAPENTLASFEKAAALGTFGVEFDLTLSRDGTVYLMHDDDLKRTTNVAQLFPGREKDESTTFALTEVKQLTAGQWFVERDPYGTVSSGAVTAAEVARYRREPVPTLAELLDLLKRSGQTFIFDLKQAPADHLKDNPLFNTTLSQMHQAGVDSQVWFLVGRDQLAVLRAEAPEMKPAYGVDFLAAPEAGDLSAQGYQIVNSEYGLSRERIRQYRDASLWVNIYTVDEAWQFSRLWLLGVNSITTSDSQGMMRLAAPVLRMPYSLYLPLWIGVGVLALVVFGIVNRLQARKTRV